MSHDVRTLALLGTVATIAAVVAAGAVLVAARRPVREASVVPFARAATALSAAVWVLLVFGSSVRVNGAGLACPDWPACFGQIVPSIDWPVFLEFGHRVYAGVVSLAFVGLAVAVLRRPSLRSMWPLIAAGATALAVQIVLGGLTVWHLLAEWTVASHLVCGNVFSALIGLIAFQLWSVAAPSQAPVHAAARPLGVLLAVLVLAQLALGGLVSSSHAGLVCATWPGCNGSVWFPTFEGLIGLQVLHRITAYAIVLGALGAAAVTRSPAAAAVAGVALFQACLGVANVLLRLPVEVTLLHSAGAAALVLAVAAFNHAAWTGAPARAPAVLLGVPA